MSTRLHPVQPICGALSIGGILERVHPIENNYVPKWITLALQGW